MSGSTNRKDTVWAVKCSIITGIVLFSLWLMDPGFMPVRYLVGVWLFVSVTRFLP